MERRSIFIAPCCRQCERDDVLHGSATRKWRRHSTAKAGKRFKSCLPATRIEASCATNSRSRAWLRAKGMPYRHLPELPRHRIRRREPRPLQDEGRGDPDPPEGCRRMEEQDEERSPSRSRRCRRTRMRFPVDGSCAAAPDTSAARRLIAHLHARPSPYGLEGLELKH